MPGLGVLSEWCVLTTWCVFVASIFRLVKSQSRNAKDRHVHGSFYVYLLPRDTVVALTRRQGIEGRQLIDPARAEVPPLCRGSAFGSTGGAILSERFATLARLAAAIVGPELELGIPECLPNPDAYHSCTNLICAQR